jgi:hypothetical protein
MGKRGSTGGVKFHSKFTPIQVLTVPLFKHRTTSIKRLHSVLAIKQFFFESVQVEIR